MKTDRGRHTKYNPSPAYSRGLTPEKKDAYKTWQRFTNAERGKYGYVFENFLKELA